MKLWIKDKTGVIEHRDKDDTDTCTDCLDKLIEGKCHRGRYAVRSVDEKDTSFLYCFGKNVVAKQAKYIAKFTTSTYPAVLEAAKKKIENINDLQTIAYHNARKLNATVGQKLESIVDLAPANEKRFSATFLTIRKIVEQIEGEYNLVDTLSDPGLISIKEMTKIRAHQLVVGEIYLYQEELNKNNVRVVMDNSDVELMVEYSIARSSIGQVLNNIAKYCQKKTIVNVTANNIENFIVLKFEMFSEYFDNDDVERLKLLYQRGSRLPGDGVGLYAIDLFQKKHGGFLRMTSEPSSKFNIDAVTYSKNVVELGFHDYLASLE